MKALICGVGRQDGANLAKLLPEHGYEVIGTSRDAMATTFTSLGLFFDQLVETMDSITGSPLNLLEAIRFTRPPIRFYNAGSGECFGDTGDSAATEAPFSPPRSPYAVAKASAHGSCTTTVKPIDFLHVPAYFLITNLHFAQNVLCPKRLYGQQLELPVEAKNASPWEILRYNDIGAEHLTMLRRCG